MTKAIICDVETTGLKDPEVVEYGAMQVTLTAGSMAFPVKASTCDYDVFVSRHKPNKPIDFGAIATHGILDEDLEGLEPFTLESVGFECDYLLGQNIIFDWKCIGKPNVKRIDTLGLARKAWPSLDSHKLMALVAYIDRKKFREFFASAHSVRTDILATAFVFDKLIQIFEPRDMEHLHEMSEDALIPKVMMFGKHKDKPIADVDRGYRSWYMREPDPDPYLILAFERNPPRF